MDKFIINGNRKLSGEVRISGAKNAALPIMTASLLARGKTVLHNVPHLNDIKMMAHLLRVIGARIDFDGSTMTIDTTHCSYFEAPYELVSKMRASIYVLGPLLARFGQARVSFPGGCAIGTRPVDLHLKAMEQLGAKINLSHGYIIAQTDRLTGNRINFAKSSVGATANALMAAVLAEGDTLLENCAREPEISSLAVLLQQMGAQIKGIGTRILNIRGVKELHPVEATIIPDRIEAGTFLVAAAITNSTIKITNCCSEHLESPLEKLRNIGFNFILDNDAITINPGNIILPQNLQTTPYPGFPTDLQAQFMSLLTLAGGESRIEDTIFPDRFMHVAELNRLDADITVQGNTALIRGVKFLSGAPVMATDLRASAALVLAGLAAQGTTEISRIYHIDRGYERIEEKLVNLGAEIKRIQG
ncbi:MAG: UDP-N-acetylglucosamine 1-carboxyvinyltransferase [Candidatus Cloacimonetes bacterium]|nr:UDP-N-acetylglucosamine 1-carboxyvinyltransferase [Candidatus Cloacimonadota bacterium]